MPEWLTIEVLDGTVPASEWARGYENVLVEAAITSGAGYWDSHLTPWGVVLEFVFADDDRLERYRTLPVVRAALDAVPDLAHGLIVYRGRGGGAGALVPRHRGPLPVAGAAPLPTAEPERFVRLGSDPDSPLLPGGCWTFSSR